MDLSDKPKSEITPADIQSWMETYIGTVIDVPEGSFPAETQFDELGLDSVELTIMAGMIEEAFSIEVEPGDIIENATVARLSLHVARILGDSLAKEQAES